MTHDTTATPGTGDQRAGLACAACGADLRAAQDAVVTGGTPAAQLLACPGPCAELLTGDPQGLPQAPTPLAIRIGRHEGWSW
ncbi:hypothetical protein [Embleya sp. AB8]|uniref:hypothetical protein n=1 Tax=Embleya sp. AB8 TaxID=3156304 RepID=UPI003C73AE0C